MNTWIDWTYIIISLQVLKNARMWLIPSNSVHSIGGQITGTMVSPTPHLYQSLNTLRPRQNGRHFTDDIFKCILLYENAWIPISLKFVPKGPINNIPALVEIMAWRRPGDKPLSGPMMVRLPTHICVTRPQWVKMWIKSEPALGHGNPNIISFLDITNKGNAFIHHEDAVLLV